jgi:hypothetical protein
MAGIDHTIYNRQQLPDYLGAAKQGMSIGQMIRGNKLQDEQLGRQSKLRDVFSKGFQVDETGAPSFDFGGTLPEIARLDPATAIKLHAMEQSKVMAQQELQLKRDQLKQKGLGEKTADFSKLTDDLRKEIQGTKQYGALQEVDTSFRKIKHALGRGTAAGDLAGVFSYMKINDPGSAVKEGEYATAKNAAGVPERVRNLYNNIKDGHILSPEQRKDFMETSKGLARAQYEGFTNSMSPQLRVINKRGLDPKSILGDWSHLLGEEKKPSDTPTKPEGSMIPGISNANAANMERIQSTIKGMSREEKFKKLGLK